MVKSVDCQTCDLYKSSGPLTEYSTDTLVDILFLGYYPTQCDVRRHDLFSGFVPFRSLVQRLFTSYSVTDCLKCTLGETPDVHIQTLPKHCYDLLFSSIKLHQPKVIVPIGGLALEVLQNIYGFRGRKRIYINNMRIFPIFHPSNPEARLSILKDLNELKEVLNVEVSSLYNEKR